MGEQRYDPIPHSDVISLVRREERLVPTLACLLLFAQKPQRYLPRCGIDFLKFEGTRQLVGQELNIIKREIIERPLLHLIRRAIEVVGMHVREYSRLGPDGLFRTALEYPPFAWEDRLRRYLREHGWITNRDYRQLMGADRQMAWRQLSRLVERGELVREGKGRYTRYRLANL